MAFGNGYTYRRTLTVDNTKVSGSGDLTNFPVMFAGTYTYLKTEGNGGKVTSSSGYDIVFYSDAAGTSQLKHELEYYDETTGDIIAYVKIPTLSYSADTTIYLFYNKSGASDTSDKTNVWTVYDGVWHLSESGNGTSDEFKDSSALVLEGTGGSGAVPTQSADTPLSLGKSNYFDGTEYITYGDATEYDNSTALTVSYWWKPTANAAMGVFRKWAAATGSKSIATGSGSGSSNPVAQFVNISDAAGERFEWQTTVEYPQNTWYYVQSSYEYGTPKSYQGFVDGVAPAITIPVGGAPTHIGNGTEELFIGGRYNGGTPDLLFTGYLKEVRASKSYLSADFLKTDYNNQSSPSTFYTLGSEQEFGVGTHIFGDEGLVS